MNLSAIFLLAALAPACLAQAQFVPAEFAIPKPFATAEYKLVPLGPAVAKIDYEAYMSSIDFIRSTMGGNWPRPGLTLEDQAKDMAGEKAQWDERKSFPYAVLTPDGSRELGCFYLRPSNKQGYDAVATFWTTKAAHDKRLDAKLLTDMKVWTAKEWPFHNIAWPGRDIK